MCLPISAKYWTKHGNTMITIKKAPEIEKMRRAGKLTGDTLRYIEPYVKPGISTLELNSLIDSFIRNAGAIPSFKNYNGYPASACLSVNDVVVHGIPSLAVLKEGDILSVDVGVILDGWQGDAARTFAVGQISPARQKLIDVTKQSFFEGIRQARAGRRLGDMGHAIQQYVEKHGFSVVRSMVGHGIGRKMHEEPSIPNFGQAGTGVLLKRGYTLAVEPMVNAGSFGIKFDADGWTCRSIDGSDSAHYENTILITDGEPEILTL